jgi:hypothetical protein
VDVEGSDPQTEAWLKKLRALAKKAPDKVRVSLHETTSEDRFGIKEVKAFFKAQAYKQWSVSAQRIFYWLIDNLHNKLVVLCQDCGLRYGQQEGCCRCPGKGYFIEDYWAYNFWSGDSQSLVGWHVLTSSLYRISPDDLRGPGMGDITRQHAIELIEHLKNQ